MIIVPSAAQSLPDGSRRFSDDFDGRPYERCAWNIVFEQEGKRRDLLTRRDGDGQVVGVNVSQQVAASYYGIVP